MASRAAYEAEWQSWIDDLQFHVESCVSSHRVVALYGDIAILTHQTVTTSSTNAGPYSVHERETIVFQRIGGRWLGVHEHLSLLPG